MAQTETRVLHLITRLIVGGAQESTLLTAGALLHAPAYAGRYQVEIVCGAQTGLEGELHSEAQQNKIPLTLLPELVREVSPVKDLIALFKLVRLLRKGRYTILHTHSTKAGFLGRLAAKLAGTPVVVHTVHGWSFHEHMSGAMRKLSIAMERLMARLCDKLIVVSMADREKGLKAAIGKPAQYVLIRSGIELDRFGHPTHSAQQMRSQLGLPMESLIVGSVTRLSKQKAPLDLVYLFAYVAAQVPDALLVIAGDGPLRPQTEALIHELGLAERVRLLGLRRDVPEVVGCFDLFVLTSLWEGLPRVLPQAMASGLAIVATAVDGSVEIVQHGITGYLCPPAQPEQMAKHCVELLRQPELRKAMGEAGRQAVSAFGAQQMVAEIDALYQALLVQQAANARQQTIRSRFVRN